MRVLNRSNITLHYITLHCMFITNCEGLFNFRHLENIQTF